ncbi:uncharacterized protein LOC9314130 [Arabidopsis lyrata subsp. lyrata]|uniref:uncharacterized protein LOC9314130 n=1 Tax=Arabidopsis lyrata subsp. lyrata TaxID=81972 RepID=UPI000A29DFFC|nr:uncharacterized protein LOC9314130 [Arabidopsis lyrata subsp. lyrata]|eukprot:XP_020881136.1 uncharacterized protein LOC9314130 [Arabidopsis lyrata subsp. lyrata]
MMRENGSGKTVILREFRGCFVVVGKTERTDTLPAHYKTFLLHSSYFLFLRPCSDHSLFNCHFSISLSLSESLRKMCSPTRKKQRTMSSTAELEADYDSYLKKHPLKQSIGFSGQNNTPRNSVDVDAVCAPYLEKNPLNQSIVGSGQNNTPRNSVDVFRGNHQTSVRLRERSRTRTLSIEDDIRKALFERYPGIGRRFSQGNQSENEIWLSPVVKIIETLISPATIENISFAHSMIEHIQSSFPGLNLGWLLKAVVDIMQSKKDLSDLTEQWERVMEQSKNLQKEAEEIREKMERKKSYRLTISRILG